MKINRSLINHHKSFPIFIRKWLILVLSFFGLLPIIHSTYLPTFNQDLSTLESMQSEVYGQNRDYFLNHINQLNSNSYDNRQFRINQDQSNSEDKSNILTKRIALFNIFGKSEPTEEDKKLTDKQVVDNQTAIELKNENLTVIDDLNKNLNQSNLENHQSAFLKNHLQNDKQIETLNRLINFSKNYENWQDHFYNHRKDLINLLKLNNTNFSDLTPTNNSNEQDQMKSKNLFLFSSDDHSKSPLIDNNQFGFKPNNFLSSLLVNDNHEYLSRFNPSETITEASDLNSEYDEDSKDKEEDDEKQIENRNENKRRHFKNRQRIRQNGQRFRHKFSNNKMRKTLDDQFNRNSQSGFRPIDKLLKEQSQISASTGVKHNSASKNYKQQQQQSSVDSTQQNENNNNNNNNNNSGGGVKLKRVNVNSTSTPLTTTTEPQEYNQLSVSNQPYKFKPQHYRIPSSYYGKRLINDILNSHSNVRKNLIPSNNNKNVVVNTASPIENTNTDQLDDENNNDQNKEEVLNEQDKQLVTDKSKELYEKNDELNDLQNNDYETTTANKEIDLKNNNNELINQQQQEKLNQLNYNQQIDTTTQLTNQPEIESNDNDSIENENDLNNSMNLSLTNQTKESDLDTNTKTKLMINELTNNKQIAKQEKIKSSKPKQQSSNNKNSNFKQFVNSNYKHYKLYDKYSKLNGLNMNNAFNTIDQNYPMNTYLSNENFKINLNNAKSELDDELSNLIPYPNGQYSKQNLFSSTPYYPVIKKKPYYPSYLNYPTTSLNPLNSMLFDKLPIDSYGPLEKLPPLNSPPISLPIKSLDKNPLNDKFYNLDNKLHHVNSKYSLNSLSPPPFAIPSPHLLETKYYEPKGHYDSKYHNIGNWQSGLAGFLLGVVPFSMLMASMVPTISAISSGGATAAALGRRRRSISNETLTGKNLDSFNNSTVDENTVCLIRLSKIIESINNLVKEKVNLKEEKTKIYFNELIELQKQCEFNFTLPFNWFGEIRKFLNFKNDKRIRKEKKDSYYSYDVDGKTNLLDSILYFFINFIRNKESELFNESRIDQRKPNYTDYNSNNYNSDYNDDQQFSIFHLEEIKCLQEIFCKVILGKNFKKSLFSSLASILASLTPSQIANKYGFNILVDGLKSQKCIKSQKSYCVKL